MVAISDAKLLKLIQSQKSMIAERTNAKKIELVEKMPSKKYQAEIKEKIKEKEISIYFDKT